MTLGAWLEDVEENLFQVFVSEEGPGILGKSQSTFFLFDGFIEPCLGENKSIQGRLFERTVVGEVQGILFDLIRERQTVATHNDEHKYLN